METQAAKDPSPIEFPEGSVVIYALHGKCKITQIETRSVGGRTLRFYKLEVLKSPLSRTNRSDPSIWVPISSARDLGMRSAMDATQAEEAMKILLTRESYFNLDEPWHVVHSQLEAAIRTEGPLGLAKVYSYMHVIKRKWATPPKDITKFYDLVHKLLFKELSEVLGEAPRILEDKVSKGLRNKGHH